MTKNNFYKYAAIALLLLHFVVIGFFIFTKSHKPNHRNDGPKNIIINRLDFDQAQQEAYQKLITVHQPSIQVEVKNINLLKKMLYTTLKNDVQNQAQTDSLITEISVANQTIERLHFAHFLDIKKLCKGEQVQKFNALTEDLAKLFSHSPKPKRSE